MIRPFIVSVCAGAAFLAALVAHAESAPTSYTVQDQAPGPDSAGVAGVVTGGQGDGTSGYPPAPAAPGVRSLEIY